MDDVLLVQMQHSSGSADRHVEQLEQRQFVLVLPDVVGHGSVLVVLADDAEVRLLHRHSAEVGHVRMVRYPSIQKGKMISLPFGITVCLDSNKFFLTNKIN
jgi:hypothetical protein